MSQFPVIVRIPLLIAALSMLSACSWLDRVFPDRSQEYRKAEPAQPLEVPPDLTRTSTSDALVVKGGAATLSSYQESGAASGRGGSATRANARVLPNPQGMRLEHDGRTWWLVVQGDAAAVWNQARAFWLDEGFLVRREDPLTGVLETDWAERRVDAPRDIIRKSISRLFPGAYSSALRDRFRMRLEPGREPGITEVFITHQGLVEELVGAGDETQTPVWKLRPSDPVLESEMLRKLMLYLGAPAEQVERQVAAARKPVQQSELAQQQDGRPVLVIHQNYDRAWRTLGVALDHVGFAVEDRDRSNGIYYVRYSDPTRERKKGLLSGLAFWRDDRQEAMTYQIRLKDDGADTRVMVLDAQGQPDSSDVPVRILGLLHEEIG